MGAVASPQPPKPVVDSRATPSRNPIIDPLSPNVPPAAVAEHKGTSAVRRKSEVSRQKSGITSGMDSGSQSEESEDEDDESGDETTNRQQSYVSKPTGL